MSLIQHRYYCVPLFLDPQVLVGGDEVTTGEPRTAPFVLTYFVADPVTGLSATAVRHVNVGRLSAVLCLLACWCCTHIHRLLEVLQCDVPLGAKFTTIPTAARWVLLLPNRAMGT